MDQCFAVWEHLAHRGIHVYSGSTSAMQQLTTTDWMIWLKQVCKRASVENLDLTNLQQQWWYWLKSTAAKAWSCSGGGACLSQYLFCCSRYTHAREPSRPGHPPPGSSAKKGVLWPRARTQAAAAQVSAAPPLALQRVRLQWNQRCCRMCTGALTLGMLSQVLLQLLW